jgi:hypothetical protein
VPAKGVYMGKPEKWFPPVTLGAILYLTFTGVVAVPLGEVSWGVGKETGALLFGVLTAVAVIQILLARFLFLPSMIARPQARQDRVVVIGYARPLAAVVYGVLISILTGQGLLTLPFAALALCGWVMVWSYLRRWVEGREPRTG